LQHSSRSTSIASPHADGGGGRTTQRSVEGKKSKRQLQMVAFGCGSDLSSSSKQTDSQNINRIKMQQQENNDVVEVDADGRRVSFWSFVSESEEIGNELHLPSTNRQLLFFSIVPGSRQHPVA